MQKLTSLIFSLFFLLSVLTGQSTKCFEETRALGLQAYHDKHYIRALDIYLAAYICPDCPDPGLHDLEELIRNAQQAQLAIYKFQVSTAKQAKQTAIQAQKNEQTAKKQAKDSAEQAIQNGRLAESLRLSLLADIERRNENYFDALSLAFYAITLGNTTTNQTDAFIGFSRVVRDSFIQYIPVKGNLIQLQNHPLGITTIDDNGFTLWKSDEWKAIHNTVQFNQQYYLDESVVVLGNNKSNAGHLFKINNTGSFLLDKHSEPIKWIASSPNYYLSCSRDNNAALWDKNGVLKTTFSGHNGNIYQGFITKSEENIITRSSDGSVKIWTIKGQLITTINTGSVYISCMEINKNQGTILLGDGNGKASLWNMKGEEVHTFKHGDKAIKEVKFIGKNNELISVLAIDSSLKIWNLKGELLKSIPNIATFGYLALNNTLFTRHLSKGVETWSLNEQKNTDEPMVSINDFSGMITAIDFNLKEDVLLSTNSNGTINLWSSQEGKLFLSYKTAPNPVFPAQFTEDGHYFFCFNHTKSQIEIIAYPLFVLQELFETYNKYGYNKSIVKKYNIEILK